MRFGKFGLLALVLAAVAGQAAAQQPATPPSKALQFADIGRVLSWRSGGGKVVFIKDAKEQWYKVDMLEPCMDLFPGKQPTFITLTDTQAQRYSAVVIERRQCTVLGISRLEGQPPRAPEAPKPPAPAAATPPKGQ
jgi:hypothetical protein